MPPLFGLLDLIRNALAPRPGADEAPRTGDELHEDVVDGPALAETPLPPLQIQKVGAWVGRSGFATLKAREKTINFAKAIGLKRLDVVVNDFSAERDPVPFSTYDRGDIRALASSCREADIDVHLLSWIMPFASFIDGAAAQLRSLVELTGAKSLVFDAEEPWTLAHKPDTYTEAAKRVGLSFTGIPLGVTGIGYANAGKLRPLTEVCDVWIPQMYATATSGLKPETAVATIYRRWRKEFGKSGKVVAGLAAYRQPPKGYTIEGAMRSCFAGAESIEEIDEAVFWSLGQIRQSAEVTRVVRALVRGGAHS